MVVFIVQVDINQSVCGPALADVVNLWASIAFSNSFINLLRR